MIGRDGNKYGYVFGVVQERDPDTYLKMFQDRMCDSSAPFEFDSTKELAFCMSVEDFFNFHNIASYFTAASKQFVHYNDQAMPPINFIKGIDKTGSN